ncbi:MAG: YdcF family protein [Saccharofermentans sp.]|nr:YdcF family protein [Saccharofermentans sp.]
MMTAKNRNVQFKRIIIRIFIVLIAFGLLGLGALGIMNDYVIGCSGPYVSSLEEFEENVDSHYDAVIVLGCAVWSNGPSPMLADRLRTAAAVYKTGCADYILVTGDSENPEKYDETGAMKDFLIDEGIPESSIVCDPLGLSTYESMLRAYKIFDVKTAVVVTTGFHVGRSVYDSHMFGIESVGVEAVNSGYVIKTYNYYREFIARGKDFVFTVFKPGY